MPTARFSHSMDYIVNKFEQVQGEVGPCTVSSKLNKSCGQTDTTEIITFATPLAGSNKNGERIIDAAGWNV